MGEISVMQLTLVWLISIIPLLIVLWAVISVVRSFSRMAAAQEATSKALRLIAEDLSVTGRRQN